MEKRIRPIRKYGYIVAYFLMAIILNGCVASKAAVLEREHAAESTEGKEKKGGMEAEGEGRKVAEQEREVDQEGADKEEGGEAAGQASRDIFAMDTYMTVTAYGERAEKAVKEAEEEILRLDALLSTGEESSEVAELNKTGEGALSEDAGFLLERSLEFYQDTEGAFDVAIYPLMQAWGFPSGDYRVPDGKELERLLELADPSQILYDGGSGEASFGKKGMQIDFGGIAKGYASEQVMEVYRKYGIASGIVNLGGNVQVLGKKPDQSLWKVAVQSPKEDGGYLGVLSIADRAVITSGGYERYFEQDGKEYHHIIDPATGYPAENGLVSVTVVSADGTLADALSTSLFVMGKEKAAKYWQARSDRFDAILLDDTGALYVTEGILDCFESDYDVQVIKKAP